jgi:hypothetical protein
MSFEQPGDARDFDEIDAVAENGHRRGMVATHGQ